MSDWIDDVSQEFNRKKDDERQQEYFIAASDYWLKLRQQIDKDVAKLNTQSVWAGLLKPIPLKVVDIGGGYYQIEKNSLDAVNVIVKNIGKEIELKILVTGFNFKILGNYTENWRVDADKDRVFLTRHDKTLIVPEQASKHILSPIIEVLNKEMKG